jgi:hypothetical protein
MMWLAPMPEPVFHPIPMAGKTQGMRRIFADIYLTYWGLTN